MAIKTNESKATTTPSHQEKPSPATTTITNITSNVIAPATAPVTVTAKSVESTSTVESLLKKDKLITEITKNVQKRNRSSSPGSPKSRNVRRDRSSSRTRRRSGDRDRYRRTSHRSSSRNRRSSRDRGSSRGRYTRRPSSRER